MEKHPAEPFFVIPSSYVFMLAEQKLYMTRNREHKLKELLSQLENQFDWILIDCPPVLGNLTDNALNAARQVVIPIQAEATSVRALDLLFDQIESVERGLNIQIRVLAVVPNLVQDSVMSKRILTKLKGSVMRKRVMLQAAWKGRMEGLREARRTVPDAPEPQPDGTGLAAAVTEGYIRPAPWVTPFPQALKDVQ